MSNAWGWLLMGPNHDLKVGIKGRTVVQCIKQWKTDVPKNGHCCEQIIIKAALSLWFIFMIRWFKGINRHNELHEKLLGHLDKAMGPTFLLVTLAPCTESRFGQLNIGTQPCLESNVKFYQYVWRYESPAHPCNIPVSLIGFSMCHFCECSCM